MPKARAVDCNSKEALSESHVSDVLLSRLRFLEAVFLKYCLVLHTVILRKPQVQAVFLKFVCCSSMEVWSCNSKEA